MRILQLCNKIPFLPKDGGALAMFSLMQGLAGNNHDVTVLAMNTTKHFVGLKDYSEHIPANIKCHIVDVNTDIHLTGLLKNLVFTKSPYILDRFYNKDFYNKIKDILSSERFDIVQLEGLYITPYISLIRECSDAKIVYRSHNIESQIWTNNAKQEKNSIKKIYLRLLAKRLKRYEQQVVNEYDAVLPITEEDALFFTKNKNTMPLHIVPFGIETENYLFSENVKHKNSLFYIGSLDWIPNIEGIKWFVQNVWKIIKLKHPGIELKVAGRNASKQLIAYLKKNNVSYIGEINESKSYFLDNNIMVVPLFAGSGMRVKIIEGMAYGKPIVSTSKGVEGIDYVQDHHIIIADSTQEFVKKLSMLIQDNMFCQQVGRNAHDLIQTKYNNQVICANLIRFYKEHLS